MDSPLSLIPTIDSLNEQTQNEDLIINIDPKTRNNLQILGTQKFAEIKFIRKACIGDS